MKKKRNSFDPAGCTGMSLRGRNPHSVRYNSSPPFLWGQQNGRDGPIRVEMGNRIGSSPLVFRREERESRVPPGSLLACLAAAYKT